MEWLNRTAELARLDRLLGRRDGSLAVVWGRRRIGKTRLLLEWANRASGVYFVADNASPPDQRRRLAESLATRLPGFADVDYRDWHGLLVRLAQEARARTFRGPIVLDELPYLVLASPELPATLQRFVDHEARQAGLVLAVAGSSQRMMQGLVLDESAPLFGRAAEAFAVQPLAPRWLAAALGLRHAAQVVAAWSVWGGVPRYLELARTFADRRTAVHDLVLDPAGVLHDEPSRLLHEELPSAISLRPVLDAIGAGMHRVSEIAGRIGSPATALARSMTRLVDLGFVVRETPFGEPERSTRRSLYRLADPFLRLWFALVPHKRALLMQMRPAGRLGLFDARAPHLDAASWEELCRRAVPGLGDRLGGDFGPAQRFWGAQGPEWDVVAKATRSDTVLLGEVKWSDRPVTREALLEAHALLVAKGRPALASGKVVHALFVPTLPRSRPRGLPADVRLIDARAVVDAVGDD